MIDRLFSEPKLAQLYDALCEGRPDFALYLPLVMSSSRVLDIGCGTGELLRLARKEGHTGYLCGLDPADTMLEQARQCPDVTWMLGTVTSLKSDDQFDLIVMTGHAFQVLIDDNELRESLRAIPSLLTAQGQLVFETRNPLAREWERWTPEYPTAVVDAHGATVRVIREVETPVTGELVSFTMTFTNPHWDRPVVSRSTLRFIDEEELSIYLTDAGFVIEEQFGDWARQPLTRTSPEIITVARHA